MSPDATLIARRLGWLLRALERRVDADLAGVRLAIIPGLPVDGLACGNLVALSADLLQRPRTALLHAAIHELVHVFQQRAGRVRPTGCIEGIAFSRDADLEAEAEAAAAAGRCVLRSAGTALRQEPVLQPLITVGGQSPATETTFSVRFNRLLGLIPSGPAWLSWALRAPGPARAFADEFSLLSWIQLGLHGSAEVCFQSAGLRLAPSLLLDLGSADFGNVVGSLETGQLSPAALAVFARLGVRTEADFAQLDNALASLGVSAALPLAAPTLTEQVALHARFVAAPPPAGSPVLPAAQFAAANASTATDFAAAFSFFLSVSSAPDAPADLPAQVWTQLSPLAFPYLQSPSLDPFTPDPGVGSFLSSYLRRVSFVGFPSLAVALAALAADANLAFAPFDASAASDRIRSYVLGLARLTETLPGGDTPAPQITRLQDGLTRWIDYAGDQGSARLQLDPTGLLTLRRFIPATTS